jgi:hypothetical protein
MEDNYFYSTGLRDVIYEYISNLDKEAEIMFNEEDLVFLHKSIRLRKPFTTMEFGVGYSTIAICHALYLNEREYNEREPIRNSFKFKHFVVDSNKKWINNCNSNFPNSLKKYALFHFSDVNIHLLNDLQLCSLYSKIPDCIPEFIYLDGPDPKDIKGEVNGLSFKCKERTVMSADLLLMETTFLPGLYIVIDGRVNNARFLERNLKRKYVIDVDKINDRTTFKLAEEKLGIHNYFANELY